MFLLLLSVESCYSALVHHVVTLFTHPLFSIVILWHSWCLCPVTPRTAWVQLCSPIIWWKAAALSSQSLQPTTLKGQCQLRLVVSGFCLCCFVIPLYHWWLHCSFLIVSSRVTTVKAWKKGSHTGHRLDWDISFYNVFHIWIIHNGSPLMSWWVN